MVKVKIRITCKISKLSVSMVIIIYPADTEAALVVVPPHSHLTSVPCMA